MHIKKSFIRFCNPKVNYNFERKLPNYVIQNITQGIFFKISIYGGERRIYRDAGRNTPNPNE